MHLAQCMQNGFSHMRGQFPVSFCWHDAPMFNKQKRIRFPRICAPMKTIELWITCVTNTFGKTASDHAAFPRVCTMLKSRAGLNRVFGCIKGAVKLHSDQGGIVECVTLWNELRKLKAGGKPDTDEKPASSPDESKQSGTDPAGWVVAASPTSQQNIRF